MNKLLVSHRQNIKRVVDVAEDLLGYRLNRLNNPLLWTNLNRPGVTVAVPSTDSSSPASSGATTRPLHEPSSATNVLEYEHYVSNLSIREEEARVIFSWVEKLKESEHPLVKYARQLDAERSIERQEPLTLSYQIRSMVVLLVANIFGVPNRVKTAATPESLIGSILSKQQALAEIAETMHTAYTLHQTVVEISKEQFPMLSKVDRRPLSSQIDDRKEPIPNEADSSAKQNGMSMHQGNKVATLMGDLLLARCNKALSSLRNAKVTELMSDSISDFSEGEAITASARVLIPKHSERDSTSKRPFVLLDKDLKGILNFDNWRRRSALGLGSLLQNACFSSQIFAGHDEAVRSTAGSMGLKIGLALQAHKDLLAFESETCPSSQVDLCTLPVIYHLEKNGGLISSSYSPAQIYDEVNKSTYAKAKTRQTLRVLTNDAIREVSKFPCSSSKLLEDFLVTLPT